MNYKHILIAVDRKPADWNLISVGLALARAENAQLSVIHVMSEVACLPAGFFSASDTSRRERVAEMKQTLIYAIGHDDVNVRVCVGTEAEEILVHAVNQSCDLVVVGRAGRPVLTLSRSLTHMLVKDWTADLLIVDRDHSPMPPHPVVLVRIHVETTGSEEVAKVINIASTWKPVSVVLLLQGRPDAGPAARSLYRNLDAHISAARIPIEFRYCLGKPKREIQQFVEVLRADVTVLMEPTNSDQPHSARNTEALIFDQHSTVLLRRPIRCLGI